MFWDCRDNFMRSNGHRKITEGHQHGKKEIHDSSQRRTLKLWDRIKRLEEDEVDRLLGILKIYSLLQLAYLLKGFGYSLRVVDPSTYSLLTFTPLHKLQLGAPTLVRDCTVKYSSSHRLETTEIVKWRKLFSKIQARVLRWCILLLDANGNNVEQVGTPFRFVWTEALHGRDSPFPGTVAANNTGREQLKRVRYSIPVCSRA